MLSAVEEAFGRAIASFRVGNLEEAERNFKEVLRHDPQHLAALNLLGMVLTHVKKYNEAEPYFQSALNINPNSDATLYNYGIILKALKRPAEALERFSQALSINPKIAETWNNRGTVLSDVGRHSDAISDFDKSISLNANYSEAYCNKGKSLFELKRHEEALSAYKKALVLKADLAEAWLGRGNVFGDLKRFDEAFTAYDQALALKPQLPEAWLNRGNLFFGLKRHDEALDAYDKTLALKPDLAVAWLGRGNVFFELNRYDDASTAYNEALALEPDLGAAWLGRGNIFFELSRYDAAVDAYDKALALEPDLAAAWVGRGNALFGVKRHDEALVAHNKALALKPDLADAWLGVGNVFFEFKRYDDASAAYSQALELKPDLAAAWLGRGNAFFGLKRYVKALAAYDKALTLKPDLAGVEGARLHTKTYLCDWSNFDAECAHLITAIKNGRLNTAPFQFLAIPSSTDDQLQCARLWVAKHFPSSAKPIWHGERYDHDRIRIGYLSADFRQHPVALCMAGLFEGHDKSLFETTAISFGPDDGSQIRQRLMASFERFVDAKAYSDDQITNLVKDLQIDILIDLMGFTVESRTGVFARRPAPIQVNYFGYPGTMGAEYIDYLIADRIVIPEDKRGYYSEKIVYLPNSFLPPDQQRHISDKKFARAEAGLPPDGFVFCSFNNHYKIAPGVFDCWMRILKQVDGSVLWLLGTNATAESNLRKEAAARGVNAERLIFAERMPPADHLARHRLADLFLDTVPYNAHTTASEALWTRLPVLTLIGDTYAGRVAASLLNAIDMPELIATTSNAYERMAIELATHPDKLAAIKRKLVENRRTTPLFDTASFTKNIEKAYITMHNRHQDGLTPDHIAIAD
jgi:protein O-GlcNAc transferase